MLYRVERTDCSGHCGFRWYASKAGLRRGLREFSQEECSHCREDKCDGLTMRTEQYPVPTNKVDLLRLLGGVASHPDNG